MKRLIKLLETLSINFAMRVIITVDDKYINIKWLKGSYDLGIIDFRKFLVYSTPESLHIMYTYLSDNISISKPKNKKELEELILCFENFIYNK